MAIGTGTAREWCHDPHVWRFVFARYLPAIAVLNVLWEVAQLPLYTLWWEAPPLSIAYAVLHCTIGDVLIGVGALLTALIATRSGVLRDWHWLRVSVISVAFGLVFTAFSEWSYKASPKTQRPLAQKKYSVDVVSECYLHSVVQITFREEFQ